MSWFVVGLLLAALALCGVPLLHRELRHWATGVEQSQGETTEKVHRLRLAIALWPMCLVFGGFVIYGISTSAIAGAHRNHLIISGALLFDLAGLCCYVGAFVARHALRPVFGRVRQAETRTPYRLRQSLMAVLVVALVGVGSGVGAALVPKHGALAALASVGGVAVALLLVNGLLAPLWLVVLKTSPLPPERRQRVMELARSMHAGVRDVRSFPARGQRLANAMQLGILPGLRYVLVSDYLLDHMDEREVEAVLAHEFGHAREYHVSLKLVGYLVLWACFELGISSIHRGSTSPVLWALMPLGFFVALIVVQGLLGIRLERRADDVAAKAVGAQPLASALAKLGELNHLPQRTGRGFNLLGQHPGLDQRLARLCGMRHFGEPPSGEKEFTVARPEPIERRSWTSVAARGGTSDEPE